MNSQVFPSKIATDTHLFFHKRCQDLYCGHIHKELDYKYFLEPQKNLEKKKKILCTRNPSVMIITRRVFNSLCFAVSKERCSSGYKPTCNTVSIYQNAFSECLLTNICTFHYCLHFSPVPKSKFGDVWSAHPKLMKLAMTKKLKDLKVFPVASSVYTHSVIFAKISFQCR